MYGKIARLFSSGNITIRDGTRPPASNGCSESRLFRLLFIGKSFVCIDIRLEHLSARFICLRGGSLCRGRKQWVKSFGLLSQHEIPEEEGGERLGFWIDGGQSVGDQSLEVCPGELS